MSDVSTSECSLALLRALESDPQVKDPFGFACAMFFAGFDVGCAPPRDPNEVEREILMLRERVARLKPKARRRANFGGTEVAMRTNDPDPKPLPPLGERVQKPAAPPAASSPQKPQGPYGVVTDSDGHMKTTKNPS